MTEAPSSGYLICTKCGKISDIPFDNVYDKFSRTQKGTVRKRMGWIKKLSIILSYWRCDDCLKDVMGASEDDI